MLYEIPYWNIRDAIKDTINDSIIDSKSLYIGC